MFPCSQALSCTLLYQQAIRQQAFLHNQVNIIIIFDIKAYRESILDLIFEVVCGVVWHSWHRPVTLGMLGDLFAICHKSIIEVSPHEVPATLVG